MLKFHDIFNDHIIFHDFPSLETSFLKFHDFPGCVGTLYKIISLALALVYTVPVIGYRGELRWHKGVGVGRGRASFPEKKDFKSKNGAFLCTFKF